MSLTLPYPSLGPGIVDNAELNQDFGAITAKFGNIDNSDIASGAGIAISKLAASYQWMNVKLSGSTAAAAPTFVDYAPIYNDGKGAWTVAGVQWIYVSAGGTVPQIRLRYGYYTTNTTTWNVVSSIIATTTLTTTANQVNQGTIAITASSLDPNPGANPVRSVALVIEGGAGAGTVYVSMLLKRQITAV